LRRQTAKPDNTRFTDKSFFLFPFQNSFKFLFSSQ
jgi:hypothetical protein